MGAEGECSLVKYLKIVRAGKEAYEGLCRYHYRDGALGPVRFIFAMIDAHLRRQAVVGVIVYGCPAANLAIRNRVTGGMFAGADRATGLALLNAGMLTIKRVVIEPRYRGLGLAAHLVRRTMPLTGAAMVEAIATMGSVHPFFLRAGMREYVRGVDAKTERMRAALEATGIGQESWADAEAVHQRIKGLDRPKRLFVEREMQCFLEKFATQRKMAESTERTEFVLSKLGDGGRYYLWVGSG
jgi:GNAT superfamily N-acetyltransferase